MRTALVLLAMLAAHHAPQGTKQITLAFQMAFQPENKTRLFFLNHYVGSSVQITPARKETSKDVFFVPGIQSTTMLVSPHDYLLPHLDNHHHDRIKRSVRGVVSQ